VKAILIVDDRGENRAVLIAMLAHRGYRFIEADSGAEGLSVVRTVKPDLIIADILMSKMDGYEFVRQLRLDPKVARTPVIFYTANYMEKEARKLARDCGVFHVIVKPAEPEEVYKVVDEVFAAAPPALVPKLGPASTFAKEHLQLVTDKLAQKVDDLEALNAKLQDEIEERKRIEKQLRAAREEAEEANRAKDKFLANLSHELRTPLTPVLLSASALEQNESIESELRQQLAMIRSNIELEARLIDDLLDLTRIAKGQLQLVQSGPVDIHSLVKHAEQIVHNDAVKRSIQVQFELNASEYHVDGDAARLHQVFWNLFKNAIKFTRSNGLITVRTENPKPGQIALSVEDTGMGIDPDALPFIFHGFGNGGRQRRGGSDGLGLGLPIAKAIVDLHGGTIRAESPGRGLGATFAIDLTTTRPFSSSKRAAVPTTEPKGESNPLRLLVIEDHEATLDILARLLRSHGHNVLTATTVKDAILLACTHSFDLVISDLGLPDGNGIDLMRQLTNDYGLRGIALSGYGMASDRAKTEAAGFLSHLVKPVDFGQLERVLREAAPLAGRLRFADSGL
jgi:signal transduction histidine kinase/response regulator of citrate/malate metabolism